MDNSKALIHIGYHKSGTSFLQEKLFEAFSGLFYRVRQSPIREYFVDPAPLHFEQAKANQFCQEQFEKSNAQYTVFSNERLSAHPHLTGGLDSCLVADRLKQCLPNGKVLMVIREQKSMIRSCYNQYLKARGSYGIDDYLYFFPPSFFRFTYLKYHLLNIIINFLAALMS